MLHTNFRENWQVGSCKEDFSWVFTIYGHGGHLRSCDQHHISKFHFYVPKSLHTKFGYKRPRGF